MQLLRHGPETDRGSRRKRQLRDLLLSRLKRELPGTALAAQTVACRTTLVGLRNYTGSLVGENADRPAESARNEYD